MFLHVFYKSEKHVFYVFLFAKSIFLTSMLIGHTSSSHWAGSSSHLHRV